MRLLRRSCCYSGREFAVETVLREALANAIIHGNRLDPKKIVRLCCSCDAEGDILIVVTDEGEGFDPSAIPSPLTRENINLERGRGICLINQFADEVRFERGGAEIQIRISARPKERSRGLEVG
jgi:serine/threonine-protein kinase RsbW